MCWFEICLQNRHYKGWFFVKCKCSNSYSVIQLAKKRPEMVVKLAIVIVIRFYSDYSDTQRSPIKDNQVKKSWTKSVLFSKNPIIDHFGPKSFEPIHTTSLWNIIFQWNFHDDLTKKSAEIFFCISKNGIISEGQWQILKIIFVLALDGQASKNLGRWNYNLPMILLLLLLNRRYGVVP